MSFIITLLFEILMCGTWYWCGWVQRDIKWRRKIMNLMKNEKAPVVPDRQLGRLEVIGELMGFEHKPKKVEFKNPSNKIEDLSAWKPPINKQPLQK